MTALAVVLAVGAASVAWPDARRVLRARGLVEGVGFRPPRPSPRLLLVAPAATLVVALLLAPRTAWALCGLAVAVVVAVALLVWWRGRAATRAHAARGRLVEGVALLAAELRAGSLAGSALASVATELPELAAAARTAAAGGDVAAELIRSSAQPGHAILSDVAAAWQVAERGGAPMTTVLERIAAHGREQVDLDHEVAAELAPARATARVLAVLPVAGLGLGASAGGDPVGVVLGTTIGAGCLLAGVVLAACGVLWIDRLTTR